MFIHIVKKKKMKLILQQLKQEPYQYQKYGLIIMTTH